MMKSHNLTIVQEFILLFCLLNKISSAFEFPSVTDIFEHVLGVYKYPYYVNYEPEKKLELTHSMKRKRRSATINEEWKKNLTTAEDFIVENLEITNKYRAIHGVPPLELDYKLCSESEEWAMELVRRSEEKGSPVLLHSWKFETGENLYAERTMKNYSLKGTLVAIKWYSQCREHTWKPNFFSSNSARFTQMIWKDTERMGIAQATSEKQRFTVVVARYLPCGNWGYHKSFEENVFPQTRLKDGITKCYKHKKAENISTLQIAFPKRPTKQNNVLPSANTKNESESKDALIIDNEEEEVVTSTTASETNSTEEYPESEEYVYSYEEDVKASNNVSKPSSTTKAPKGRALPLTKNDSVQKKEKRKDKKASIHSNNKNSTKKNVKKGKKKAATEIEVNDKAKTKESSKSEDKSEEDNSNSTKDKNNHSSGTDDEVKKQKDADDKENSEETEVNDEKEKKEETTETPESEVGEKKSNDSQNKNTKGKHERGDKESKTKQKHPDKKKVKIVNKVKNPSENSAANNSSHQNKKQDKNKDKNEATTVTSKKEETTKAGKSETKKNKNHVKDHKTVKQRK